MGTTLPDLDTRSVLDVVEENFEKVGLKTYACRMIYVGEHTRPREELIEHFDKIIKDVNAGYCDIHVRGLLLVYDSYFVHIVEGSEDTIHRHVRFMFHNEKEWAKEMERLEAEALAAAEAAAAAAAEEEEQDIGLQVIMAEEPIQIVEKIIFKRMKIVMIYDCIKQLDFNNWRAIAARPPSLVGRLDVYGPLQDHLEQLRICLDKITKLCALANADPNLSFEGLSAVDPKMEALPEVALVDFLLQSQYILDLRETVNLYRRVDDYRYYFEEVWPLPTHFTPRLLYKLKIDDSFVEPLPVMPWEKEVKKEVDEDEYRSTLSLIPDEASVSSSD